MKGRTIFINYSDNSATEPKCFIFSEIIKFIGNAIKIVHFFYLMFIRLILSLIYGKGEQVFPTKDKLVLESVTSLAEKIRNGNVTSTEVVKSFIARILEINQLTNSVVDERFKEALLDANKVDELLKSKSMTLEELKEQKPLLGIPFTTKDSVQVKHLINSSGLHLRKDVRANEDAESIKLLRDAGAIPIAITNVPEICMWWESNNTLYGRCKNPYNTSRTPGGSSGGEGCVQATAGSGFGIGTDVGGSIRIPSFFNGIFGHKPSKLIVSTKGLYPPIDQYKEHLWGIGPICRHAKDLKLILKVIAGNNASKLNLDEPVDLKKIKIYYQLDDGGGFLVQPVNSVIKNLVRISAEHFEKISEETPTRVQFTKLNESADIWFATMKSPEGSDADRQLANFQGKINPYIEFGKLLIGKSQHTLIAIINAIIEKWNGKYGSKSHQNLMKKCEELQQEISDLLGDDGVLLYPTHPTVAPYHWEPIFRMFNFVYTGIFNSLGFPATTIPMGLACEGLPAGIQVIANHNQDRLCLAVAEELEKSFGGWVQPSSSVSK